MQTIHKLAIILTLLITFLAYSFKLYRDPVAANHPTDDALKGKQLWQNYNCGACHQVYGLGGFLGPDLTNVYARRGPEYIHAILGSGIGVMPDFKLSSQERDEIVAYLEYINTTGKADPRTFIINTYGTISQAD